MKSHFARYAEAYFVGGLFVLLQLAISLVAQAKAIPHDAQASMTGLDWWVFRSNVLISAIPTIIAFLNGSVAKAAAEEPPPPASPKF